MGTDGSRHVDHLHFGLARCIAGVLFTSCTRHKIMAYWIDSSSCDGSEYTRGRITASHQKEGKEKKYTQIIKGNVENQRLIS